MEEVYILDALRTPIGKYAGVLSRLRPDDMAAHLIRIMLERNHQLDPHQIEEVVLGAANQAGEDNRNIARMSALLAGLPVETAGVTVNRLCASGLQAIMDASRALAMGQGDFYLAGGVESMSRAPWVMAKPEQAFGRQPEVFDTTLGWRFTNPLWQGLYHPYSMGETAENVAERYRISREDQDDFAQSSQEKYAAAQLAGAFDREIVATPAPGPDGKVQWVQVDEHPRLGDRAKLAQLKPVFREGGSVTAGNSSGINDGAALLLLASGSAVQRHQLQPLGRIVSMAVAGVDPSIMGIGPVPAVRKALKRAGLQESDLGLIELNEAFASQALACQRELGLPLGDVNVHGGAIALGHPLGCSGARITTTLLHALHRYPGKKSYGLATMCVGVGQGAALVIEALRHTPSDGGHI
jgi:acetyl-CoA C-acetyltransferase